MDALLAACAEPDSPGRRRAPRSPESPEGTCLEHGNRGSDRSGLSLRVDGGSTADGADIDQSTYHRAPEEQWQIIAL